MLGGADATGAGLATASAALSLEWELSHAAGGSRARRRLLGEHRGDVERDAGDREMKGLASTSMAADRPSELRTIWRQDLSATGGFLPERAPLTHLPPPFQAYLDLSRELPHHYPARQGGVRRWLDSSLPAYTDELRLQLNLLEVGAKERLMTSLAALGHAYRWNTIPPAPERFGEVLRMPDALALPWLDLARVLDVPRVGSAWNLHVSNWRSNVVPGWITVSA